MRKIRPLPTWPLVALTLSAATIGGVLGQRPDSEPAAAAPSSAPAPTTTTSAGTSTVTSVRTVTVAPRTTTSTPTRTPEVEQAAPTSEELRLPQEQPAPVTTTTTSASTTTTSRPRLCDPSYPTLCLPLGAADLDCSDIPDRGFPVRRPDRHRFDDDRDGVGCES
ncbi:hypothetical protein [Actinokineospora bangkokensis]|uniref:Excalibur calcium-binding domain-containing protein n=1 Tax=Actinokineospora bangkokensis TaxID=1193682 RepID=A0A1Q9LHA2_9PSEU|nr:hypothetical protein [Actinokineospora bangkokensis]OLR91418.1 hypothetical protein BJP25_00835 [Actinokineospora bangkokensis]